MKFNFEDCPFQKIFPSSLNVDDIYFMSFAYNEAIDAWKEDEVPIGAVIVFENKIIASAHNQTVRMKDPTAHAEMLSITQAARIIDDWRLNECTLYVTKEPCPMCAGASIMSRLKKVVYAWGDPKMGGLGGAFSLQNISTLNHHPEIISGVLEAPCRELVQTYFQIKRTK